MNNKQKKKLEIELENSIGEVFLYISISYRHISTDDVSLQ